MHRVRILAAAALLPSVAVAAGAQLAIQQVDVAQKRWPHARAYLNVINASGSPIQNLPQDLFKVYELGATDSQKVERVESLEAAQTGASIVIVVQASGAMMGIQEDLKKAVAGFVNSLGEKDQVAVVDYAESAEMVAPFSDDKGDVAGKAAKITFTGKSFLLYDGLAQLMPSPVVELNRAVAVGMAFGPQAALEIVDRLREEPALDSYHLLPSVRGDLLDKLGRPDEARAEFEGGVALLKGPSGGAELTVNAP